MEILTVKLRKLEAGNNDLGCNDKKRTKGSHLQGNKGSMEVFGYFAFY
jgi:hypothetical protein